jgi:hypothetical protein
MPTAQLVPSKLSTFVKSAVKSVPATVVSFWTTKSAAQESPLPLATQVGAAAESSQTSEPQLVPSAGCRQPALSAVQVTGMLPLQNPSPSLSPSQTAASQLSSQVAVPLLSSQLAPVAVQSVVVAIKHPFASAVQLTRSSVAQETPAVVQVLMPRQGSSGSSGLESLEQEARAARRVKGRRYFSVVTV